MYTEFWWETLKEIIQIIYLNNRIVLKRIKI